MTGVHYNCINCKIKFACTIFSKISKEEKLIPNSSIPQEELIQPAA